VDQFFSGEWITFFLTIAKFSVKSILSQDKVI